MLCCESAQHSQVYKRLRMDEKNIMYVERDLRHATRRGEKVGGLILSNFVIREDALAGKYSRPDISISAPE